MSSLSVKLKVFLAKLLLPTVITLEVTFSVITDNIRHISPNRNTMYDKKQSGVGDIIYIMHTVISVKKLFSL